MTNKYKVPSIEELISSGVHFGHQVKRWHPKMEPYIYTVRQNIHIIDMETTEEMLKKACTFLYETAKKGGKIIFVGTKKQAREIVEIEAKRSGALFVTERWLGGTITNFEVIKKNNIDKLLDLKKRRETGQLDHYTKKERLLIDREIDVLERYVGGLTAMSRLPDAIFVIDARREKTVVREARLHKIPLIALIDTNTDPTNITYPIPGNDDAIKSIACIVKALSEAVNQGYKDYSENSEKSNEKDKEPTPLKEESPVEKKKVEASMSEAPQKVEADLLDDRIVSPEEPIEPIEPVVLEEKPADEKTAEKKEKKKEIKKDKKVDELPAKKRGRPKKIAK